MSVYIARVRGYDQIMTSPFVRPYLHMIISIVPSFLLDFSSRQSQIMTLCGGSRASQNCVKLAALQKSPTSYESLCQDDS